jgi:hypothetical protein
MNLEFYENLINYAKVEPMVDDDMNGYDYWIEYNIKTQIIFVLVFFFSWENLNPKMFITFMFYVKSWI